MSIIVKDITKIYGTQKVLDSISFEVHAGEVIGLLGPNGAGKSTLMKIITCFIPPASGEVRVYGYDIFEQSIEVRKKIGYLPENNPLYTDMYVKEFLEFVAGIYKLGGKTRSRIAEMIEITGLQLEQNKKIGALSRGYRQRVGLAQALIHDPEVLILDEPTSGLDPNQILEIRNLIKEVGKQKTVMLSTHIMQEVEAICDRVIIINKGQIVADDSTANLSRKSAGKDIITVEFSTAVDKDKLNTLEGVLSVLNPKENTWIIESDTAGDIREVIFKFAVNNGLTVLSMVKEEQRLEEVFQKLTRN